ncbi:MAG: hypothetical protein ABWY00_00290 [Dongiaceae bacterium]
MKSAQALIKTFLLLGPMAVALSIAASSSSYAEVDAPGSTCSPFFNDPSCADVSPTIVVDRWTDWTPHRVVVAHEDLRLQANGGYDQGLDSGLSGEGSNLGSQVDPSVPSVPGVMDH